MKAIKILLVLLLVSFFSSCGEKNIDDTVSVDELTVGDLHITGENIKYSSNRKFISGDKLVINFANGSLYKSRTGGTYCLLSFKRSGSKNGCHGEAKCFNKYFKSGGMTMNDDCTFSSGGFTFSADDVRVPGFCVLALKVEKCSPTSAFKVIPCTGSPNPCGEI